MKKSIALLLVLAFALMTLGFPLSVAAKNTNTVTITVTMPDTVKVGESWNGVMPEIAVEGDLNVYGVNFSLVAGTEADDAWILPYGNRFVQKSNQVGVGFYLYPEFANGESMMLPEPMELSFVVNGEPIASYMVTKQYGENGECYRIETNMNLELSDRIVYSIKAEDLNLQGGVYIDLSEMPKEAEAGASFSFRARLASDSFNVEDIYSAEGYTINGDEIEYDATFVMPERDVIVDAKVKDRYKGWEYVPQVDITLNFDEDIYYGRTLPTDETFMNALSVSSSVEGVEVKVSHANVETLYDESTGGDLAWVGNQFLSFWIQAEEGYLLYNPYLPEFEYDENGNETHPREDWLNENLKITFNGIQRHFALSFQPNGENGSAYAEGYWVSGYYVSPDNAIELHVEWAMRTELPLDTSGYKAGETVVVPDSLWVWDGYMPTGYLLSYTHPENGEMLDHVYGKSFVMPESDGEVKVIAMGVKGKFGSSSEEGDGCVVVQQSQDSDGYISLDVHDDTFADITIVQINKINEDDFYGDGYEILEMVNQTLSDISNETVTFEIKALSYNQEVQPRDVIIVTFPIPEGFDSKYIAFYHVDKNGSYEIVPAMVDHEKGVCKAVIEHFSTYVIAYSVEETPYGEHSYKNGICQICGETDPDYVPATELRRLGDVNNDGEVNKMDYLDLKRYCFDTKLLDDNSLLAADVNRDNEVNKMDYLDLKRFCFNTKVISPEYIEVPIV